MAVDQFYPILNIERKASKWLHVALGEIDKNSGNTRARSVVKHIGRALKKKEKRH